MVLLPDADDAVDILLPSLMQVSLRYHPLASTSPNIVDSLIVLTGRLEKIAIQDAGRANQKTKAMSLRELLSSCIRLLVEVDGRLHRRQFWTAYQLIHLARERLLQIFATSRILHDRTMHSRQTPTMR